MNTQQLNSNTDKPLTLYNNSQVNVSIDPSNPENKVDNVGYTHNKMMLAFQKVVSTGVRIKGNDYVNYYIKYIENLNLSDKGKQYLMTLGNILSNGSSYLPLKNSIINLENQISVDTNIGWGEKSLILSMSSIARYSSSIQPINLNGQPMDIIPTISGLADMLWWAYDSIMGNEYEDKDFDSFIGSALQIFPPLK